MDVFSMSWYLILTIVSLVICITSCLYHVYRIISLGVPNDYSEARGNISSAVAYSFTGGMSPKKKESAYLHLPTYTAGILYHLGTFFSVGVFICVLFGVQFNELFTLVSSGFLFITGISGIGILVKRMLKKQLRSLSNPDDYISNLLVSGFQLITMVYLNMPTPLYFIMASALLLYLPIGKLKHTIYFFAARFHLGFFFGRRGVWPPNN